MHSRFLRTVLSNIAVAIILEFALCYAIADYFNDQNVFFYALMILLAFWALQTGIGLKNLVVATIHYYLFGKRVWVAEIQTALRRGRFPIYHDFPPDAGEYLGQLMNDKEVTYDQLVFAAASLGQLEILKIVKPTHAWRFMSVLETALDNYRRTSDAPIQSRE